MPSKRTSCSSIYARMRAVETSQILGGRDLTSVCLGHGHIRSYRSQGYNGCYEWYVSERGNSTQSRTKYLQLSKSDQSPRGKSHEKRRPHPDLEIEGRDGK